MLAVAVEGVSKQFVLPHERVHTLKERALHPFRRAGSDRLQALDDVSFAVAQGEFFGIVGRNGSGKSTLLKCLAGIYRVDARRRSTCAAGCRRSSSSASASTRTSPRATTSLINGIMLGLSPKEARARFDSIIEFAELEEFVDLKLKNYSSGMQVRLAFSVMIQVDADILLIDEVLAVGDAAFQQKCFDVFQQHAGRGQDDPVRHPRHGRRAALLRPRDAARARPRGADRRARRGRRRATWSCNFGRDGRGAVARTGGEERFGDRQRARSSRRGSRTSGAAHRRAAAGRAVHASHARRASTRRCATRSSPSCSRTSATTRCSALSNEDGNTVTGAHEAGDEATFSVTFDERVRARAGST